MSILPGAQISLFIVVPSRPYSFFSTLVVHPSGRLSLFASNSQQNSVGWKAPQILHLRAFPPPFFELLLGFAFLSSMLRWWPLSSRGYLTLITTLLDARFVLPIRRFGTVVSWPRSKGRRAHSTSTGYVLYLQLPPVRCVVVFCLSLHFVRWHLPHFRRILWLLL